LSSSQELEVAEWVERFAERRFGRPLGDRRTGDGIHDPDLTVDFIFDRADVPTVLEVTRLMDTFENPASEERKTFEKGLNRYLRAKDPGRSWVVAIDPEASLKAGLAPSIERLVEWMLANDLRRLRPGMPASGVSLDFSSREGRAFARDCHEARIAGVVELERRSEGTDLLLIPLTEFSNGKALLRPIARAFEKKATPLAKAKSRGYVTVLAIDVVRDDAGPYLTEGARVGDFPPPLDHLWLFLRGSGGLSRAFYSNRTDRSLQPEATLLP
jgi:hypothetical protein